MKTFFFLFFGGGYFSINLDVSVIRVLISYPTYTGKSTSLNVVGCILWDEITKILLRSERLHCEFPRVQTGNVFLLSYEPKQFVCCKRTHFL